MFDSTSRYFKIEISTFTIKDPDNGNKEIKYVKRRFLPSANEMTTLAEHTVTQDERLDNITAYYLGDPTQFWRLCDANEVFEPEELTDEIGIVIKISAPNV